MNNLPQLLSTPPNGVVLSATQLDIFDLCKRKWAFQYILKIKPPPKASAILGGEVHKHLERWLKFAIPPPDTKSGRIATKMLVHLPPPNTGAVEQKAFIRTARGHIYVLIIDWTGRITARPTVIDHKTTSSWEYAKTAEELPTNIQAILYAEAGFVGFQENEIDLFWNYGTTGTKIQTRPVKTTVHLPVIHSRFETFLEEAAAEILFHYQHVKDPLQLPPTPSACDAFGGCAFQGRCKLTVEERITGIMGTPPSMAERMRQQAEAAGAGGVPPMAMIPPEGGAAPADPRQAGLWPTPGLATGQDQQPVQQPATDGFPPLAPFNPEGGPNPPESGQVLPPPAVPAATAVTPAEGQKAPGRPRGAKNKLKAMGELPTTEQWAFMIGVQAALNGGPQPVEVLVQAGDLALAAFKAKFG